MNKIVKISLISTLVLDTLAFGYDDANVEGDIRILHSGYTHDNSINSYATALGGGLRYKLAQYYGLSVGVAFSFSQDVKFASGNGDKRNDELSSTSKQYTTLSESYINYKYNELNIRIGRQIIDTPLADSDDIRMIPNTFEAYIATYNISNLSIMAGNLRKWQGVDAGLDNSWIQTTKHGVSFIGITFENDDLSANAWSYNIEDKIANEISNNSIYLDLVGSIAINKEFSIQLGGQYLNQSETKNSGIKANIYGLMAGFEAYDFSLNFAYNFSEKEKGKTSFSGFGGGTLFTNMESMILNEITQDRDSSSAVVTLNYAVDNFNLLYAYGNFQGDANSNADKEHIVEQNIGLDYSFSDNFILSAVYVIDENKEDLASLDFNNKNFRFLSSYSF